MERVLFVVCLLLSQALYDTIGSKEKTFLSLNRFVQRLEEYAPLKTAIEWDNVGLLVEPSGNFLIKRVLVTNDLTAAVLDEAITRKVDLIISYHPPMVKTQPPNTRLKPITRLTQSNWKEVTLIKCIENRIAIYSPHTTWDSIDGGINDWILSVFSKQVFF
jgi:putative NIF3 family GTP cyclohydrolase 1 type 2